MERESYIIRAPGKLSLLGEYAVLEEGVPAVVAAISKHMYCNITTLETSEIFFRSSRLGISPVQYEFKNKKLHLVTDFADTDLLTFSRNAIEITLKFLEEKSVNIKGFEINMLSDLNTREGVKYGFGSSAAVTVSIVAAILYLHGYEINKEANREAIFKLSAIAHFLSQGSGSGLDIAASTFGGLFIYKSFSSDWMKRKLKNLSSVRELVNEKWKFFYYEKILVLIDFHLCVGWTGKSASTRDFLEQVAKVKNSRNEEDIKFYSDFLRLSKNAVEMFVHGIRNNKREHINKSLVLNRNLLKELSAKADTEMETERLKYLVAVARKLGFEAKFSGAGGGDCGFAVVYDHKSRALLKEAWKKYGIEFIDVNLDEIGVCEVNFAAEQEAR